MNGLVRYYYSYMTVLRDSIHIGSMSPSKMIHFGPSAEMFA